MFTGREGQGGGVWFYLRSFISSLPKFSLQVVDHLVKVLLIRVGSDVSVCFTNGYGFAGVGRVVLGGMHIELFVSRFNVRFDIQYTTHLKSCALVEVECDVKESNLSFTTFIRELNSGVEGIYFTNEGQE